MIKFIQDIESLQSVKAFISTEQEIGFDTETETLSPFTGRLLAVQIGNHDVQHVIAVQDLFKTEEGKAELLAVLHMLEDKLVLGHNLKFDIQQMLFYGVYIKKVFDTFIAEAILSTGMKKDKGEMTLKTCCAKYANVTLNKEIRGQIIYKGFTEDVIRYCAEDVAHLHAIKEKQSALLAEWYPNNNLINLEMKFVHTLARMEFNGILLDTNKWNEVYKITSEEKAKLELQLDSIVAKDPRLAKYANTTPQLTLDFFELPSIETRESKVKWSSAKQKGEVLKILGFDFPSTDKKYLLKVNGKHPIIFALIKYSEHNKLASTYGKKFLQLINPVTKRLHANFFQIVSSGRMSCSKPNLLNIPKKGTLGKTIRSCFIARPGYKMTATDFSNFELRIIAEFANEPSWTETFQNDGDLHTILCIKTFNISESEVRDKFPYNTEITYREVQKTVDFGLSYGMSKFKLSETIGVLLLKAENIIEDFFKIVPRVKQILDTWAYAATSRGYIRTPEPYRRVRWFPKYTELQKLYETQDEGSESKEYAIKKLIGEIARPAKNQIPQGTNGDIIKDALNTLQDTIDEYHFPVELKLSIYDEVLDETRDDFVDTWVPIKERIMIQAAEKVIHKIPIKVETKVNQYWEK